ncbi:MAG TPA: glycine betaine ABC transporter substrate-binding protein [Polyangiaceae bacterium]|jgi:glycine betaine/proline transport system substrate-binding protein
MIGRNGAFAGAALAMGMAALGAMGSSAMGCSSSKSNTTEDGGVEAGAALTTIKLVKNPWDASRLDAAIAQILLTDQLHLTVTVDEIDEFAQFPAIAAGTEHASFEVWPSGHAQDIAKYVDTGQVEDGGLLGPVGKISWYIPTYLLTTNPALASYQAFKDPAITAAFATPQTGAKGQFLTGDPSWTQYDADIIRNLGLNLQVVTAGTEDAELMQLDDVYNKRGSILMYLWTPHAALAKYNLSVVALPPYDPNEYASAEDGGVACDYPPDHLFKIFWPQLKTLNPAAYRLLKNVTLTNEEQIELLGQVDNLGVDVDTAARAWVSANQSTWQAWLPQ